ncbi:hypothetical protein [Devosia sp.]|uniref:hypothetical protein n=1 Tax=Devosia sp. TaxID=1871048 RepID=UPI002AFEB5A9|nr:hypothetical protein [Devosia sp.]
MRLSTGTVTVANGETAVTAWLGDDDVVLSEITAPAGSAVVIEGCANFIAERSGTTAFSLLLPHAGAGGSGLATAINAAAAAETQVATLNARTARVIQELSTLDANGRGLFFNLIGVTGDNDPGPGRMAFNAGVPDDVTEIYFDVLDANEGGRDVTGLLGLWKAGTVLIVRSLASTAYAAFQISSTPDATPGYRKVAVAFVGSSGALAEEPVGVEWVILGEGIEIGRTGPFAERADFDDEPAGFIYASVNGDGDEITTSVLFQKRSAASADWSPALPFEGRKGDKGNIGNKGWSPVYALVPDGERRVERMVAWVGGEGSAPTEGIGKYLGPLGLVDDPGDATDVRGPRGLDGDGAGDVIGPASSMAGRIAVFKDGTGKELDDGGKTLAELTPEGYDDLLVTVSLLALQVADNSNAALFLGANGNRVADSFDTLTYVDVAGATNLDTSTPGALKPTASSANTLVNIGLDATSSSWAGNNLRQVFAAGVLSTSGTTVRFRMRGPFTGTTVVAGMTIGHRAVSGNAWDMASTPVPVTVGGQATFTLATGADVWSDWIEFAFDEAKDFIVAIYQASTSYTRMKTGLSASYNVYYKASGSEIATAAPAGYSTIASRADCVEQIDVQTGLNNMTVRSASLIAAAAPVKTKALLRVKEVDPAVAGVDYTLECSRDDGATWSSMALAELFTSPSPTAGIRVIEAGATDVSGQPSGTAPRWRFKTLNAKNVELHDVYFYWS